MSSSPSGLRAKRFRKHRPRLRRSPDMNPRTITRCATLVMALFLAREASAQGPRVQLDHLNRLADVSKETVDVTVDASMLKETAGFLAGRGSDTDKVHELIEGIRGIY